MPARRLTFPQRNARNEEDIRLLKLRQTAASTGPGGDYSLAFIVGGEIEVGLYIPPWENLLPDPADGGAATAQLVAFSAELRAGTATIGMLTRVGTSGAWTSIFPTADLVQGQNLRPTITAAAGAVDLSVKFRIVNL